VSALGEAFGIQHRPGDDPWWKRAACIGQPFERFYPEPGSRKGEQGSKVFEDRARRICARCPVRRPCLREAITAEEPTTAIVRNVAPVQSASGRRTVRARNSERILAVGIFGGCTATERWAKDVRGPPIDERLDVLEGRFLSQSHRWLTRTEVPTPAT
jgi:WhiB family transcriptional regulator, redox-sensing transcriptional regulator